MPRLAIMIGGGVPMKDHDNWLQVALTNGLPFGDGLRQRYNNSRWDGAGRSASATGEIPQHLISTGCNNPVSFPGSDNVQNQESIHCSRLESFQHPRP